MNKKDLVSNIIPAVVVVVTLAVILAATLPGCSNTRVDEPAPDGVAPDTGSLSEDTYRIIATTTQAADLLRIITGGAFGVDVTGLMGAGVDPHLYQPSERDIRAMNAADMIVYSGLHLEGQFDSVFESLGERGVTVYAVSTPVKRAGFVVGALVSNGTDAADDPHFWFDPRNWRVSALDLGRLLGEVDPKNAGLYESNAASYALTLDRLFEWANTGMQSVAEDMRFLVTSHDAFQYFGAAFGWRMAAIQGISTEDEAGVGDIQGTVDFVVDRGIPVLFIESSIPPNTIQAVIEAVRASGGVVRLGVRELFGDAMGVHGTFGGTYVGMIAYNVLTILQSYRGAGVEVVIPEWPGELFPAPAEDLFADGSGA